MRLREIGSDGDRWWPSFPNARDWRDDNTVFEGVGIGDLPQVRVVAVNGGALRVPVSRAAGGLFETLGVRLAAGRFLPPTRTGPEVRL